MTINITYCISPHGFGHAARAVAVMEALLERDPRIVFDIFTTVPEWFFASLPASSLRYHLCALDVGLVQLNPLEEDLSATILKLEGLIASRERLFSSAVSALQGHLPRIVISDIAPLGLELACRLEVSSCLIENFRWEWIYEAYVSAEPRFREFCELFTKLNRGATYHLQCSPVSAPPAELRTPDLICNPIARRSRGYAADIRRILPNRQNKPLVLLTMGGTPASYPFLSRLQEQREVIFIMPASVSEVQSDGGIVLLPRADRQFYHPDLVAAVDLVVGKAGYSTMAEVLNAGTPYLFVPRPSFRESSVLSNFILSQLPSQLCSHDEFVSGEWIDSVPELIASPGMGRVPVPVDGAGTVAEFILAALGSV